MAQDSIFGILVEEYEKAVGKFIRSLSNENPNVNHEIQMINVAGVISQEMAKAPGFTMPTHLQKRFEEHVQEFHRFGDKDPEILMLECLSSSAVKKIRAMRSKPVVPTQPQSRSERMQKLEEFVNSLTESEWAALFQLLSNVRVEQLSQ